jgi:hypothetical protein
MPPARQIGGVCFLFARGPMLGVGKLLVYHYTEELGKEKSRPVHHFYFMSKASFTAQELLDAPIKEWSGTHKTPYKRIVDGKRVRFPFQMFSHYHTENSVLEHQNHEPYLSISEKVEVSGGSNYFGENKLPVGGEGFGAIFDFKAYGHLLGHFEPGQKVGHAADMSPERRASLIKMSRLPAANRFIKRSRLSAANRFVETLQDGYLKSANRVRELSELHGLKLPQDFPRD